ncbi:hypothetical protein CBL_20222, partial [Carabus blaptoides fortunei]
MSLSLKRCTGFMSARGMSLNCSKSVAISAATVKGVSVPQCDRLVRRSAKRILHLSGHTGNQLLHASLRDGGLGLTQLRMKIPSILSTRLVNLFANDPISATLKEEEPTASFVNRVARLSSKGPPDAYW